MMGHERPYHRTGLSTRQAGRRVVDGFIETEFPEKTLVGHALHGRPGALSQGDHLHDL
jgi:hypothetical protein